MCAVMTLASATAQVPFFQIPSARKLESASSVAGMVLDAGGWIIPHAAIELIRNGSGQRRQFSTDGDGRLLVKSLTPGVYSIQIKSPGFRPFTKQIELTSHEEDQLAVTMDMV